MDPAALLSPARPLRPREVEVLQAIADGYVTSEQIRGHLFISVKTAKQHLGNIYAALEVNSRTAAILVALQRGLIVNRYEHRP